MEEDAETIKLGGNIELSGFRDLDGGTMVILKKIIGNYVRRLSDSSEKFESFRLHMKQISQGNIFEVHGHLIDNGKNYAAEHTDRNLFVTVNKVLSKIESSMK
ncbi:hypothetical protein KY325_00405 [Candidatus Woesearchaeota archaeon]|nr:hypothetical protein [Candidatus Woesearchaeota archaeon]MBW3017606.1 hypothetical protein [Candidatus Woesearchaeota archaeon]